LVADGSKERGGVASGEDVRAAGRRRGHEINVRAAVRVTALAHVVGLRAEGDRVDLCAVGGKEPDGFTSLVELEAGVQIDAVGTVLLRLVVGPDQQEASGGDGIAGRN